VGLEALLFSTGLTCAHRGLATKLLANESTARTSATLAGRIVYTLEHRGRLSTDHDMVGHDETEKRSLHHAERMTDGLGRFEVAEKRGVTH